MDEIATLRRDNEQLSRMYAEAMLTIRCLSGDTSDEEQADEESDEESDEEENADGSCPLASRRLFHGTLVGWSAREIAADTCDRSR